MEGEPVAVELVLVPLMLLPVLGVSLRTCFATASQHFPAAVVVVVALGDVVLVVVDVWATARPMVRPAWRLRSLRVRQYAIGRKTHESARAAAIGLRAMK